MAWWLAVSAAWAGRHAILGQVTDRNGAPLPGAIVSLAPGAVELVTDREGRFAIDYLRDADGARTRLAKRTDYTLEVFRPGYHVVRRSFSYKRGGLLVEGLTLTEEALTFEDPGDNLDPAIYADPTHSGGANYEGQ